MRPCDCKSITDYDRLEDTGMGFNQYKIYVADGTGIFLEISPYVRIRIPSGYFKRFAEWYLEDQNEKK